MDPWAYVAAALVAVEMTSFIWILRHDGKRYFIRPMKRDQWGVRFEIVSPDNKVVGGPEWHTVAKQRCAALNLAGGDPKARAEVTAH